MSNPTFLFNFIASNLFQTNPTTQANSGSKKQPDKTQNIARNINQSKITQAPIELWYQKTQIVFAAKALSITSALAVVYVAYKYFTNGNIPANTNFLGGPSHSSNSNTCPSSEDYIDPCILASDSQMNSEKEFRRFIGFTPPFINPKIGSSTKHSIDLLIPSLARKTDSEGAIKGFIGFTPHSISSNISPFPKSGNENTSFIEYVPPARTLTLVASSKTVELLPSSDSQEVQSQTNQIPEDVKVDINSQDSIDNSIASTPPSSAQKEDKAPESVITKKENQLDGTSTGLNALKTETISTPEPAEEPRIEFGPPPKPPKKSKKSDKNAQAVDEAEKTSKKSKKNKNKKAKEESRVEYGPQNKPIDTKKSKKP